MKDSVEKVKDIDDMAEDSHEEEIETEKEWMESEDTTVKDTVIPPDFARNLEDVFGIIEDRIMDNGEGKMIYDIQYLLLFNSDRTATLAEEPILAFKYQDIRKLIHLMQPKKKFNEIYYKSFADILEKREFQGVIINLSGYPMLTGEESKLRDFQMLQYEHHCWDY